MQDAKLYRGYYSIRQGLICLHYVDQLCTKKARSSNICGEQLTKVAHAVLHGVLAGYVYNLWYVYIGLSGDLILYGNNVLLRSKIYS